MTQTQNDTVSMNGW